MWKDRHLGQTEPQMTRGFLSSQVFKLQGHPDGTQARQLRRRDATVMPDQITPKEKGDATCKQYAIPINNHIPPCRPASNPAQWRRSTPRRIASQYEVSRSGICSSPEPAVSVAHPTGAYHLNRCIHMWWPPSLVKHYRLEPIASFPGADRVGGARPVPAPLLHTNTDASGLLP